MKKFILFSVILITTVTFCQKDNELNEKLFSTQLEVNHYALKNKNLDINKSFEEITSFEIKNITDNSEGKFPLFKSYKKKILNANSNELKNKSSIFINKKQVVTKKIEHIFTKNYTEFIDILIAKMLIDKNITIEDIKNESFSYGDRNLDMYKHFMEYSHTINMAENLEVQLGKNIYPYLNKLLKSELDRTLQNSLNLLAINF